MRHPGGQAESAQASCRLWFQSNRRTGGARVDMPLPQLNSTSDSYGVCGLCSKQFVVTPLTIHSNHIKRVLFSSPFYRYEYENRGVGNQVTCLMSHEKNTTVKPGYEPSLTSGSTLLATIFVTFVNSYLSGGLR